VAVTKYVYDGDTVLQEYDALGATQAEYTSTAQGYGDLLSAYDGSAATYYEPDALGSTDALADQSQTVVDRWRYRAFGSSTQTLGTDATPFNWVGRQGYYGDSETGLYQLGNGTRYYDPQTAQFLSKDPIGFASGDANLRRYVGNNPVKASDPSGRLKVIPTHPERTRTGVCGGADSYAEWTFELNYAKKKRGFIVQKVDVYYAEVKCPCTDWCSPEGVREDLGMRLVKTYYESWQVEAGDTLFFNQTKNGPPPPVDHTDEAKFKPPKDVCAAFESVGTIRFFFESEKVDPTIFDRNNEGWKRGGPGYVFFPGRTIGAGDIIPSTDKAITWFDTDFDKREGTATRSAMVISKCCGDGAAGVQCSTSWPSATSVGVGVLPKLDFPK
jgi:RHS repeat-associated protein